MRMWKCLMLTYGVLVLMINVTQHFNILIFHILKYSSFKKLLSTWIIFCQVGINFIFIFNPSPSTSTFVLVMVPQRSKLKQTYFLWNLTSMCKFEYQHFSERFQEDKILNLIILVLELKLLIWKTTLVKYGHIKYKTLISAQLL